LITTAADDIGPRTTEKAPSFAGNCNSSTAQITANNYQMAHPAVRPNLTPTISKGSSKLPIEQIPNRGNNNHSALMHHHARGEIHC
jgi:hypothetical protein